MKNRIKKPYDPSVQYKAHVGESDLVQRQFKDECDVNNIMRKYQKTGLLNHVNQYQGNYGHFTDTPTFQEAFQKVADANEMFMTLPSSVREKFAHDPGLFLEYVDNPDNEEGMRELGLLPRELNTPPQEVDPKPAEPAGE